MEGSFLFSLHDGFKRASDLCKLIQFGQFFVEEKLGNEVLFPNLPELLLHFPKSSLALSLLKMALLSLRKRDINQFSNYEKAEVVLHSVKKNLVFDYD